MTACGFVSLFCNIIKYLVPRATSCGRNQSYCLRSEPRRKVVYFHACGVYAKHIVIPLKGVGGRVNIEVDVLGKYVERSMASVLQRLSVIESRLGIHAGSSGQDG